MASDFHIFVGVMESGNYQMSDRYEEIMFDNLKLSVQTNGLRDLSFDTDHYVDLTEEGHNCVSCISTESKSDIYFIDTLSKNRDSGIWSYQCKSIATRLMEAEDYLVYSDKSKYDIMVDVLKLAHMKASTFPPLEYFKGDNGENPFETKQSAIFDGNSYLDIFLGVLRSVNTPLSVDFCYDSVVVTKVYDWHSEISIVNKDFLLDHVIDETINLGVSPVETEAIIRPIEDPMQSGTTVSSEEVLGVDLSKYWPHFHKVFGTVEASSGAAGDANEWGVSSNGTAVMAAGTRSASCDGDVDPGPGGYAEASWGWMQFSNHCPMCGKDGTLRFHSQYHILPAGPGSCAKGIVEGEITCFTGIGGCDGDFSIFGGEKSGVSGRCSRYRLASIKPFTALGRQGTETMQKAIGNGEIANNTGPATDVDTDKSNPSDTRTDDEKKSDEEKAKQDEIIADISDTKSEAMLSMGDSIKDFVSINLTLPEYDSRLIIDRWIYMVLPDDYVLKNLEAIYKPVSERYPIQNKVPFSANWWYVSNLEITYSIDKYETNVDLRLLPESSSNYIKVFSDAVKAYTEAQQAKREANVDASAYSISQLKENSIKGVEGLKTICSFLHANFEHCGGSCDNSSAATSGQCVCKRYQQAERNCSGKVCVNCQGIAKCAKMSIFDGHPNYSATVNWGGGDHVNMLITFKEGGSTCFNASDCCTGNGHSGTGQIGSCSTGAECGSYGCSYEMQC